MNQLWRSNHAASIDGRRVVVVWPESIAMRYARRLQTMIDLLGDLPLPLKALLFFSLAYLIGKLIGK